MAIKTPLEILGLVLGISGAIAGVYIIAEQLFKSTVFTIFLKAIPAFLQSFFPNDAAILWFTVRANQNLYTSWHIALIYFVLTPTIFALFIGCWLFLMLALLGIFNIGIKWLIIWYILVAINYMWSATNQYALEIKFHDRRLGAKGIINRMLSDLPKTMKRWSYYFLTNWIRAPFIALRICLITFLFVLLHWPAWLVQIIPAFRFDLTIRRTRRYYYSWYAAIFIIAGLVLTTLF
ncbi:MAG: hypothetical protein IMZ53_06200 [Thermoplasmata archaeon]|nr:hypothetical protein [Thermoplasmata archaeon]